MELTIDQKNAVNEIINFLLDPEQKELILSSKPGCGKSALTAWFYHQGYTEYLQMCSMFGVAPKYSTVCVSATTNKAAANLSQVLKLPVPTVHNLFNLVVKNDYTNGSTSLVPNKGGAVLVENRILFIDECSMIDGILWKYIQNLTHNCKIVYVGDQYQLPPVGSNFSIFKKNIPIVTLNQQVRYRDNQGIISLSEQLMNTVKTGVFNPITADGKQIVHVSHKDAEPLVKDIFKLQDANAVILTYTNQKSNAYADYIKYEIRGQKVPFYPHNRYNAVNPVFRYQNTSVAGSKVSLIHTEEEIEIKEVGPEYVVTVADNVTFTYTSMIVNRSHHLGPCHVNAANDPVEYRRALKVLAKAKNWHEYFKWKECIAELRPREACTIHKAQGSTVARVVVDLTDLGTCTAASTAARLLYVACTRAYEQVILIGDLPKRYGGKVIDLPSTTV